MSKSANMHSDRVSTTASEVRKSSKPIMEKRRRARINASLAELKSLLLEVIKKEGARHSKMEKADILEMAVKHLRQIQRQQYTGATGSDPTLSDKYRLGFNECAQEVSRYLGATDDDDAELRARLLNHLANCVTSSDSSSSSSSPVPAAALSPSLSPSPSTLGSGADRSPRVSSTGGDSAGGCGGTGGVVSPVVAPIPVRAGSASLAGFALMSQNGGNSPLPHAFLLPAASTEINNNLATLTNNNLAAFVNNNNNNNVIVSTGADGFAGFRHVSHHVTLATATSPQDSYPAGPGMPKVIGELVMPPKARGGDVAFVLPASHYIIYASPPSTLTAGAVPSVPNAHAPTAVPLPVLGSGAGNAGLVALGAGLSPALVPQTSVSHVVTGFGTPVAWQAGHVPVYSSSLSTFSVSPSPSLFSSPNAQPCSVSFSSASDPFCSPATAHSPFPSSPSATVTILQASERPTVIASAQPLQLTLGHKRFASSSVLSSAALPPASAFSSAHAVNLSPEFFRGLTTSTEFRRSAEGMSGARASCGGDEPAGGRGRGSVLHPQLGDFAHDEQEQSPWRPW